MNMKKSIAGVMAGAMAVSAMAATVSADQDTISLVYDLKRYEASSSNGQATYVESYAQSTEAIYTFTDASAALTFEGGAANILSKANDPHAVGAEITVTAMTHTADGSAAKTVSTTLKYAKSTEAGKKLASTDPNYVINDSVFSDADGDKVEEFNVPISFSASGETGKLPAHIYNLETLGYSDAAGLYGFNSVSVKIIYEVPAQWQVPGYSTWSGYDSVYDALGIDKTKMADVSLADLNSNLGGQSYKAFSVDPTSRGFTSFTAGSTGDDIYPMKSGLNTPANVVKALQDRKAGGNYYTRPVAVINDAIANSENVTFTFTSYNGYVATAKSHLYNQWVTPDKAYGYETSKYDWYNPTFAQHLYTNLNDSYSAFGSDAYDMYGSYSSAWGINLFTGAIVVNSGLTMQLNDTDKFSWGANTLTFDWYTITDDGKITDAKTFMTSMLLYTPVDWYWDNLTVTVGDAEEENVDGGEGIDGEGDTIEDEVDAIIDDIIEDVEPEEVEPEVVEPAVEEVAPVPAAPSPATGNAPVALAVIPVALAAAAVVAKKRG